jgi:hypothetical protein
MFKFNKLKVKMECYSSSEINSPAVQHTLEECEELNNRILLELDVLESIYVDEGVV